MHCFPTDRNLDRQLTVSVFCATKLKFSITAASAMLAKCCKNTSIVFYYNYRAKLTQALSLLLSFATILWLEMLEFTIICRL